MSAPLVPSPLDYIGRRPFSFYPPIWNAEPNEWVLGSRSCSEVQVVNPATGGELWISRRYLGAVSDTQGPVLIVGLTKELEYRAGTLGPRVKRVIEMPHMEHDTEKSPIENSRRPSGPAPVVGIRIESCEDSSMNRGLLTLGIGVLVVSLLAALTSVLGRL